MHSEVTDIQRLQATLEAMLVSRFHATPFVRPQEVGSHSINVAFIATYIRGGTQHISKDLLLACLTHDQEEFFTGDIPFTAKRDFPRLRVALAEAEAEYAKCFMIHTTLTPLELFIMKLADTLDGLWWTHFFENSQDRSVSSAWRMAFKGMMRSREWLMLTPYEADRAMRLFENLTGELLLSSDRPSSDESIHATCEHDDSPSPSSAQF